MFSSTPPSNSARTLPSVSIFLFLTSRWESNNGIEVYIYIYIYLNSLKPNSIVFICYRLRQQTQSGVQCGDRIHRPHLCHHGCRAHYVSSWPGFCLPKGEGERFLFNYSFLKCLQLVERIENGLRTIKAEITSWTMSVCPYLWSCLYAVWHISVE